MIGIMLIMITVGVILSSLSGYVSSYNAIFGFVFFILGLLIAMMGAIIMIGRAKKTGASYLLSRAEPNKMLWFYIRKDGVVKILQAEEEKEGFCYCPEIDAYAQDKKAYRIFDHSIRFVPEDTGLTVDHKKAIYATRVKRKYGFENLKQARSKIFGGIEDAE